MPAQSCIVTARPGISLLGSSLTGFVATMQRIQAVPSERWRDFGKAAICALLPFVHGDRFSNMGSQLMGWMAPATIGVAIRHTAGVHIC